MYVEPGFLLHFLSSNFGIFDDFSNWVLMQNLKNDQKLDKIFLKNSKKRWEKNTGLTWLEPIFWLVPDPMSGSRPITTDDR